MYRSLPKDAHNFSAVSSLPMMLCNVTACLPQSFCRSSPVTVRHGRWLCLLCQIFVILISLKICPQVSDPWPYVKLQDFSDLISVGQYLHVVTLFLPCWQMVFLEWMSLKTDLVYLKSFYFWHAIIVSYLKHVWIF